MGETTPSSDSPARYSAPALDKGLDVLELLAAEPGGLGTREIAQRLRRSTGELFRMLLALERRGYIRRGEDGSYALTLRMFELAARHPPTERLITAALPEMGALADRIGQSCHLTVYHDGRILVLTRVESPRPWGLMVRVGAAYSLADNASGRVLLAFQPPLLRQAWLERAEALDPGKAANDLDARLAEIRACGYESGPSDAVDGVQNITVPVIGLEGRAVAALAVPFLAMRGNLVDVRQALPRVIDAAQAIAARLGFATPAERDAARVRASDPAPASTSAARR